MHEQRIIDWMGRQAGARLHDAGPAALHFGNATTELEALAHRAALLPSPRFAQILVEGDDAVDYLHRRLTQSVKKLELGTGAHALLLDGEGRMQADLLVYRGQDAMMLVTERPHVAALHDLVDKYVLMDRVELTKFWESEPLITLAGPLAPGIIEARMDPKPPAGKLAGDRWCAFFTVTLAGLPCRIFGDGRFKVPVYHIAVPPMALEQMLAMLGDAAGTLAGNYAFEHLRIESGVPRFGFDTDHRTIPLEAALVGAISFDKGCYPGQEFLARIRNLGHPAKAMVRLTIEGEHAPGDGALLMIGGEDQGRLTSYITWPGLGRTEALGYLNWKARGAAEVELEAWAGTVKARAQCLIADGEYKE